MAEGTCKSIPRNKGPSPKFWQPLLQQDPDLGARRVVCFCPKEAKMNRHFQNTVLSKSGINTQKLQFPCQSYENADSLCRKYLTIYYSHIWCALKHATLSKFWFSTTLKRSELFSSDFFCTLSWSSSKSFRVVFRVLTSLKDAIFVVFLLIASRKTLKNLTEEATQNVKAQQCHRKREVVKKFIYFG